MQLTKLDDGSWTAFDPTTSRSWMLTDASAQVLRAALGGWSPGQALPAGLSGLGSTDTVEVAFHDLQRAGLLAPIVSPGADADELGRLRVWTVQPPKSRLLTFVITKLGVGVAVASLTAFVAAIAFAADDLADTFHALASGRPVPPATLGMSLLLNHAVALLQCIPHEWGHAITLAAYSRHPVAVGLRNWRLFLQAFSDTTAVVTLPGRQQRLAVLLAGTAVELLFWSSFIVIAKVTGALSHPVVRTTALLGGPITLGRNLFLPFLKNDGYFVLRELTGVNRLSREGSVAAAALLQGADTSAEPSHWWLPWYGTFELLVAGLAYGFTAAFLSFLVAGHAPASIVGLAAGGAGVWWTYHRNLAT